jgi:hypothetical protein
MKIAKPHINNLSTLSKVMVGDMVCYDIPENPYNPSMVLEEDVSTEHGIVIEVRRSIVKIRPLIDFTNIKLINAADCRVIKKTEEDEQV